MIDEKRAAVVKRGADRDHRDLFASRPADLGSVKQTLRPPPVDFGGVAARNETSVLFTVDALRNAANGSSGARRVNTPEPEPAPLSSAFIGSDDEGVIDLKALASTPPTKMGVGARSVAPLFSEPPPGAFAADVDASGASDTVAMGGGFKLGKRAIAGIAAAAIAVVLCSVGLAAAFKGEEPVARVAANAVMAPVAPPPPVVVAPAPVVIAPATASTSSTDDDAKAPSVGVKGKGKGGKSKAGAGKASFTGATKVQSSGVAVSKPSKAADKCGCKGDFNCILRCTAKGN